MAHLSLPEHRPGRAAANATFFVQLGAERDVVLRLLRRQSPLAGLVVIVALIVAILATIRAFWRLDRTAGLLLLPYLAWVSYATAAQRGRSWQLNG